MAKVQRGSRTGNARSVRAAFDKRAFVEWFKSCSLDERRQFQNDLAKEELERWRKTGGSNITDAASTDPAGSIAADVLGRALRRRALGAPKDFGEAVQKAKDADDDRRWEAEKLNPLRRQAVRLARDLRAVLRRLVAIEMKQPSLSSPQAVLARLGAAKTDRRAAEPLHPPAPSPILFKLSDPQLMAKLLPYLVERLDGARSGTARPRGRPAAMVRRAATNSATAAGLGNQRIADLLVSEGVETEGAGDVRTRVRKRRGRMGGRKGSSRT